MRILLALSLLAVTAAAQSPTASLSWDLPPTAEADAGVAVIPVQVTLTMSGLCLGAEPATVTVALEADGNATWSPDALVFEIPLGQGIAMPVERTLPATLAASDAHINATAHITGATGCPTGAAQAELAGNVTIAFEDAAPVEALPWPGAALIGLVAIAALVRRTYRE